MMNKGCVKRFIFITNEYKPIFQLNSLSANKRKHVTCSERIDIDDDVGLSGGSARRPLLLRSL